VSAFAKELESVRRGFHRIEDGQCAFGTYSQKCR
jgi:hypothetical protein